MVIVIQNGYAAIRFAPLNITIGVPFASVVCSELSADMRIPVHRQWCSPRDERNAHRM